MKLSITVRLRWGYAPRGIPHWSQVLGEDDAPPTHLEPSIDRVLARFLLPVWVTSEYAPHRAAWSPEELASGLDRIFRLVLQRDGELPPGLIDELALLPVVEQVRLNHIGHGALPPLRAAALSDASTDRSRRAIRLDEAHRLTRGDPAILIAVLDTGVDLDHPEYVASLRPGQNFFEMIPGAAEFIGPKIGADPLEDQVGHGTHVAGIISARGAAMPEGVAPRCALLPVRVLGAMRQGDRVVGAGLVENINNGLKWAVDQGAEVVNMSLGVKHAGGGLPHEEVVDYAARKGVTIVAASGNDGTDDLYYPGALDYVIAVGAVDGAGEVAAFSTWGPQVDLVAPGTAIYSSFPDDAYAFSSGTSHAAPFVAGVVALLKSLARQRGVRLRDHQVKFILEQTSDKVGVRFKDIKAGFGRVNAEDALRLLQHELSQARLGRGLQIPPAPRRAQVA